jgi:uncharacterized protein (TIGR02996 family)
MPSSPLAPELLALLDEARSRPEDDTPRLVLAEWLEDHGDAERAEFIRLDLRRHRLPAYDPEMRAVIDRQTSLVGVHGLEWFGHLARVQFAPWFRRGLLHLRVGCDERGRTGLQEASGAPEWAWVEALHLWGVNEGGFASLPGEALASIHTLYLEQDSFSAPTAREWSRCPHLGRLKSLLVVSRNFCEMEVVEALASSPNLDRLTALTLNTCLLRSEALHVLAHSPRLAGLTRLDLGYNQIGAEGVRELARAHALDRLESLYLYGTNPTREGIEALAKRCFPHLTSLDLRGNALYDTGIEPLTDGALLQSLHTLDLSDNNLGHTGAQMLAQSAHASSLTSLDVHGNRIQAVGALALLESPRLDRLTSLNLSWNALGDEGNDGIPRLAQASGLMRLHHLSLAGNYFGPEGARALAESPHLASLRFLDLSNNPIKEKGAQALADSPYLDRLAGLDLRDAGLRKRAVTKLRQRFGKRVLV